MYAHEVEVLKDKIIVKLDDPDDESDYYVEWGELHLTRGSVLVITASF